MAPGIFPDSDADAFVRTRVVVIEHLLLDGFMGYRLKLISIMKKRTATVN
jgi:hypothetical protein